MPRPVCARGEPMRRLSSRRRPERRTPRRRRRASLRWPAFRDRQVRRRGRRPGRSVRPRSRPSAILPKPTHAVACTLPPTIPHTGSAATCMRDRGGGATSARFTVGRRLVMRQEGSLPLASAESPSPSRPARLAEGLILAALATICVAAIGTVAGPPSWGVPLDAFQQLVTTGAALIAMLVAWRGVPRRPGSAGCRVALPSPSRSGRSAWRSGELPLTRRQRRRVRQ